MCGKVLFLCGCVCGGMTFGGAKVWACVGVYVVMIYSYAICVYGVQGHDVCGCRCVEVYGAKYFPCVVMCGGR